MGLHDKPVILYNVNGFYDALLQHFKIMLEEGFIRAEQKSFFRVATTPEDIVRLLKKHG
ncbi:LOG family protein [Lysinibacillus sp. D4B1_S16]|uniref:LOG family protein n=1 Tax=Lysinibacillus sp. D4B1_S16 TaxID=2941231 RepID=UPI00289DF96D|nr:LOG family protein [Lysinibacillus sp. D4B1_S16]